jgi:hypothetical protein
MKTHPRAQSESDAVFKVCNGPAAALSRMLTSPTPAWQAALLDELPMRVPRAVRAIRKKATDARDGPGGRDGAHVTDVLAGLHDARQEEAPHPAGRRCGRGCRGSDRRGR